MDLYEYLNERFPITEKIVIYYDFLVSLVISNASLVEFTRIVDSIKDLKLKEDEIYNGFSFEEMKEYISKLSNNPDIGMEFKNIRINSKLISTYDRLRGYSINCKDMFPSININKELSITDIVNSKINIDTYKLVTMKLENLVCSNDLEAMYKDYLIHLNIQNYIYKMSIKETSELLMIESMFNIKNVLDINLSDIERIYFNKTGNEINVRKIVETNIYCLVINFLDSLLCNKMNSDDLNNIYYNLFMISHVEVLLDYLDLDKLNTLSLYYGRFVGKDKMITSNVRELIKRKIKENGSK